MEDMPPGKNDYEKMNTLALTSYLIVNYNHAP